MRNDLEQYGGTNDITLIYGNEKKGLFHIAEKHGGIKTLLHVLDAVVDGNIIRYSSVKKTVNISKGDYEAVLSLNEKGKKKTWLLTGYNTKTSPDAERQVSANLKATQSKPTFSRQDLGAGLQEFNIAPSNEDVNTILKQLPLSEADINVNGENENILFQQGGATFNGLFDTDLKAVVIGSNFNEGTLPHEIAHFWLDKLFSIYKTGNVTETFNYKIRGFLYSDIISFENHFYFNLLICF